MEETQQDIIVYNTKPYHVVLLGDSVLDDFYWLSDSTKDVRYQLEALLKSKNPQHRVSNWAVDESTIDCVLNGKKPRSVYVNSRSWNNLEAYPTESNGKVYPLRLIQNNDVTHAVLSIGGNDARSVFAQTFDLENIYKTMIHYGIVDDLKRLVKSILKYVPNLILVYVYHPQITWTPLIYGLPPEHVVTQLLIKFSPLFFDIARDYKLPLLDLSRTFNPHDSSDYGTTPIEPSNKSGQYIANLIDHIIEDFSFGTDESKVYWGAPGHIKSEPLATWDESTYKQKLEQHLQESKQQLENNSICLIS
jgi:hypothetical protein